MKSVTDKMKKDYPYYAYTITKIKKRIFFIDSVYNSFNVKVFFPLLVKHQTIIKYFYDRKIIHESV